MADEAEETELEHIAKSMALAVTMVGVAAILSVVAASVAVAMVHWLAKVLP